MPQSAVADVTIVGGGLSGTLSTFSGSSQMDIAHT